MRRRLARVLNDADSYVQKLNNRFADPSGDVPAPAAPGTETARSASTTAVDVSVVKTLPTATQGR